MTCLTMDAEKIQQLVNATGKKRKQLLRENGVTDEELIQKLASSGRNGLLRYLKSRQSNLPTQTPASAEPSTPSAAIPPSTSSEEINRTIQTLQALVPNHTAGTIMSALLSLQTMSAGQVPSKSGLDQKAPTQT